MLFAIPQRRLKPKWLEVWAHINMAKSTISATQRDRCRSRVSESINTGDDSYGAQAAAKEYLASHSPGSWELKSEDSQFLELFSSLYSVPEL